MGAGGLGRKLDEVTGYGTAFRWRWNENDTTLRRPPFFCRPSHAAMVKVIKPQPTMFLLLHGCDTTTTTTAETNLAANPSPSPHVPCITDPTRSADQNTQIPCQSCRAGAYNTGITRQGNARQAGSHRRQQHTIIMFIRESIVEYGVPAAIFRDPMFAFQYVEKPSPPKRWWEMLKTAQLLQNTLTRRLFGGNRGGCRRRRCCVSGFHTTTSTKNHQHHDHQGRQTACLPL